MSHHIENSIRKLRFEHNEMTQAQLGECVGLTRQTIAAIEQGKYSPTLEVAFKMAALFSVSIEDIFQWVNSAQPPN